METTHGETHVDGAMAAAYDLRTEDARHTDKMRALRARVGTLEARVDYLERLVLSSENQPGAFGGGRPGVLITRAHGEVNAQHIVVHHTTLLDAAAGIAAMTTGDTVFVQADAAGAVLDALGVTDAG